MRVVIPENLGGDLRLLPPDTYEAEVADIFVGESQAKQPKLTVKFTLLSEYTGPRGNDFQSCVGEVVLDTFSLQPQAIWRFNDFYKAATGERLAMGDWDMEEFEAMMKEALIGRNFNLLLDNEVVPTTGAEQTKVQKFSAIEKKSKVVKKKK
jgi:hypothetical protein